MAMSDERSQIIERRNESRRWMKNNLWDELTDVFRAIKCRTKPITKTDEHGKEVEDKSRTNVAMPDLNIIFRRNVARMTAQPYLLNVIGGSNPLMCDAASSLLAQQYDRSDEAEEDVRVVMAGEAFGIGIAHLHWDKLAPTLKFRKALVKGDQVVFRDRATVMQSQGAPQDEIDGAVQQLGPEMSDDEISALVAKSGDEIQIQQQVTRYEGPIVTAKFPGDIFWEPGVLSLQRSSYVIEQMTETDLWLIKQAKSLTYEDENGNEVPAFDPKAVKDLLESDADASDPRTDDLRQMFEASVGHGDTRTQLAANLRKRKRYDIIRQDALGEDGRIWTTWIAERGSDILGRMPYPWDFYGKYAYTAFVPLLDMVSAVGDSTPRLLRFLHAMHNLTVGQNFDYVTNTLRPLFLTQRGNEIVGEVRERSFGREVVARDIGPTAMRWEQMPGLPAGAFEREAQILRMEALCEPAMNTVDTGTNSNPMAGKLATTAMLNAKAADALMQFKIQARNRYLKELGQKKLWMNQQAATETAEVSSRFWSEKLRSGLQNASPDTLQQLGVGNDEAKQNPKEWALSDRNGQTVAIRLDPYELQEDLQIEPEAGSYMAVDDELNQQKAMALQSVATANPGIIDQRKVARFQLRTIPGIGNPDDYLVPEQTGPTPPPVKANANLSFPMDKMPADIVNQLLPLVGLQPSQELAHRDTIEGIGRLNQAAQHADELTSPAPSTQPAPLPDPASAQG